MDQYVPLDIAYLFEHFLAAWVVTDEAALPGFAFFIILPFFVEHGLWPSAVLKRGGGAASF